MTALFCIDPFTVHGENWAWGPAEWESVLNGRTRAFSQMYFGAVKHKVKAPRSILGPRRFKHIKLIKFLNTTNGSWWMGSDPF